MNSLPEYISHKVVKAAKIKRVIWSAGKEGGAKIFFENDLGHVEVNASYMRKHNPKEGGYFVVYEDGYQSFSPAIPFEKGYNKHLTFSEQTLQPETIIVFDFVDLLKILFGRALSVKINVTIPTAQKIESYNSHADLKFVSKSKHFVKQDKPGFGYSPKF